MTILIEIPTKGRDSTLGRCLAALYNQSCQGFDVLILNDGYHPVGDTKTTEFIISEMARHHDISVRDGSRISQAHNHNMPLYDRELLDYEYILRLDDDILLDRTALARMVAFMDKHPNVGAVSGLWFEMEWKDKEWHDRAEMSFSPETKQETSGDVGAVNSNWQQRMYHPSNEPQAVNHLYGPCMYRAGAMRHAGGWPEVYSKGVAHGEETDGTFRLCIDGFDLFVLPDVTGQHLKTSGGIRADKDVGKKQFTDCIKWRNRLPLIEGINFNPTVAVWCQHSFGVGGAQRQFYQTVSLLQSKSGLRVDPVFTSQYMQPEECEEVFGVSYEERDPLDEYDVCIVMGHEPFVPVKAKHYILYVFFPEPKAVLQSNFDSRIRAIVGNSKYTAQWIENRWRYKASHIYPAVDMIGVDDAEKDDLILCVSRGDPHKAPMWLMERFKEIDLPGWEFHLVMATTGGVYTSYEEQLREFASKNDDIFIHENVSDDDLVKMYRRSKILWSANGIHGSENPQNAEHFGLTPIESWSAKCLPIVFDWGGHKETVDKCFRWSDADSLKKLTVKVAQEGYGVFGCGEPVALSLYNEGDYAWEFEQLIRRVNALALNVERVEVTEVKAPKIRVGAWTDSPRLTTGFGTVASQIYNLLGKQNDIELCVFGMMDSMHARPDEEMPFHFMPSPLSDPEGCGNKTMPHFFNWARPDVMFWLYDPGGMNSQISTAKITGWSGPNVAYFPIEGLPAPRPVGQLVSNIEYPVTYCKSAAEHIKLLTGTDVDFAYHGIDHAPFEPLNDRDRNQIRNLVGWGDKFVIINVGTNKRVKQQPYLIEMMRHILKMGHDDIYLYMHTKAFDNHVLQGWVLDYIRDLYSAIDGSDLKKHILFPRDHAKWAGPPYKFHEDIPVWKMTKPPLPSMRGAIFEALDLITRYQIADLYVDTSSVEGWGLPTLESVACGTPAITVDDGHVRSEVHSKYCYTVSPKHWTTWHTGARLQLIDPEEMAQKVIDVRKFCRFEAEYKSKMVRDDLPWEPTCEKFLGLIRTAYGKLERQ